MLDRMAVPITTLPKMIGSGPENGARMEGNQGVDRAIHSVIMCGAKMIACAMAAADSKGAAERIENQESDLQDPRRHSESASKWRRGFFASGPRPPAPIEKGQA
ncbi:MAG: hypothetical protein H7Z39_10340 [Burkholderiaceae bacterium]|nr:hypothetical protein [Burkholderiaceae bacterium]